MAWSLILGPLDGQGRSKSGATPGRAFPAQRAAVLLDDLSGYVEAEPRSLRLGGEELLEKTLPHVGRDAGSGVADGDLDVIVHAPRAHGQLAPTAQRLQAVLHEVERSEERSVGKQSACG